ncbi:MAG: NAD(P)/FAD-dependent oxidoreductase, partial [Bacteroidia bacterium]
FILVGQGLAGSILALELLKQGKSIWVIDEPSLSSCSKAAGGIYNPVIFKRLTQSWMAEKTLPYMLEFFHEMEKLLGKKLVYPTKIAKVFSNENEENLWRKKAANELAETIDKNIYNSTEDETLAFIKGNYSFVTAGGYVDVPGFLTLTQNYLREKDSLIPETFDTDLFSENENGVRYKDVAAGKIIFCQGHLSVNNPYFSEVKFKPAKGEVLTIYCEDLKATSVVTKDIFILPLAQKHHFKIGATYDWDDMTDAPTEKAKDSLEEKLKLFLPYSYKIVDHQAGVRPSTIDRRPAIGFNPEHKNTGIFNGFGTKSVMLAPWFAKHFCRFMDNKEELLHEVNCKRFFK